MERYYYKERNSIIKGEIWIYDRQTVGVGADEHAHIATCWDRYIAENIVRGLNGTFKYG